MKNARQLIESAPMLVITNNFKKNSLIQKMEAWSESKSFTFYARQYHIALSLAQHIRMLLPHHTEICLVCKKNQQCNTKSIFTHSQIKCSLFCWFAKVIIVIIRTSHRIVGIFEHKKHFQVPSGYNIAFYCLQLVFWWNFCFEHFCGLDFIVWYFSRG